MKYMYRYDTEIGLISIIEDERKITNICFKDDVINGNIEEKETDLIKKAYIQIEEYLKGKRKSFDIAINPNGTEFMKKVWYELCKILYGNTVTYKEIAKNIGNEKACRAVGNANNKNPIPIIIPCHRVIGTNGNLIGYRGGIEVKKKLLELEKNN